jgi:hypothetical protein
VPFQKVPALQSHFVQVGSGEELGIEEQFRPSAQAHWPEELHTWPVGQAPQAVTPVQLTSNEPAQVFPAEQTPVASPCWMQDKPPKAGAGHSQEPYMTAGPDPEAHVTGHQPPLIGLGVFPMMTVVTVL